MDISLVDINTKTLSLTGSSGAFVQGQSVLAVFVQGVQSVDNLTVQVGSKSKTGTTSSLIFGVVDNANVTVTVSVSGIPTTFTRQLTLLSYAPIALTASIVRGADTSVSISLSGTLFALSEKNTLVGLKYRYKATDSTVWSDYVDLTSVTTVSGIAISYAGTAGPFDRSKSYNLEFVARDSLTETTMSVLLSLGIAKDADTLNGRTYLDILKIAYYVGKVIMSTVPTNPASILGFGTWVIWSIGRTPVGIDPSQAEFNSVEKTGGEKTHPLSINEMPSHTHAIYDRNWYVMPSGAYQDTAGNSGSAKNTASGLAGGDQPHNNLQPFITCYYWKRTA